MYPNFEDVPYLFKMQKGEFPFYIRKQTLYSDVPLHHHNFVELSLIIGGEGVETLNNHSHPLIPGTVSFLLPHHFHEYRLSGSEGLQTYYCSFDIQFIVELPDHELKQALLGTGLQQPSFVNLSAEETKQYGQIMQVMVDEYSHRHWGKQALIRTKLIEALLYFARKRQQQSAGNVTVALSGTRSISEELMRYVHVHYAEQWSLQQLAERFNVSISTVSRTFMKYTGKHLLDYKHELRVQSACSLLHATDMSITDIAMAVGFDSFRTFSRVFKKMCGFTPNEYRQNLIRQAVDHETVKHS